ncbi:hypothetical protein OS493_008973 [Desmophyllum pertusum]|uniref:Uncharacterized protein n=1 Tax=Desmophyllum pertusum TaxID=174260 RepID=A0A9W9ZFI4_9CNID|nr:hypothetical protein OS493_008973 [Desmophyllum pertusum]
MEGNEDCVEETETVVGKENSSFILKDEDSLDVDLYEDLSVDLNQEMTYPELKKLYEESQQKIKSLKLEAEDVLRCIGGMKIFFAFIGADLLF